MLVANRKLYRIFRGLVGQSNDAASKNIFLLFRNAVLLVFCVLLLGFVIQIFDFFSHDAKTANQYSLSSTFGTLGDFVGGVLNPILTFITFIGLLITIVIQKKELALTRDELATSSKALSLQAKTQEQQRFESTFFSLLDQHNKVLSELCMPRSHWSSGGSDFDHVYSACFAPSIHTIGQAKLALKGKNEFVGHYFRILYQILKLVSRKHDLDTAIDPSACWMVSNIKITEQEKFYSNLVRSFLSYEVTQLLAINCYADSMDDPYVNYRKLIERYSFLEHMPFSLFGAADTQKVAHPALKQVREFYEPVAFGNSEFL